MSTPFTALQARLPTEPRTWLVTGVAGFIGSNLLEALLKLDQRVIGLDNFATGLQRNLDEVQSLVTPVQWASFRFIRVHSRRAPQKNTAKMFLARSIPMVIMGVTFSTWWC